MPSPLAHALAGAAVYAVLAPEPRPRPDWRAWAAAAVAGAAADLDFVPGLLAGDPSRFHHGATHSVAATLLFVLLIAPFSSALGSIPRRGAILGAAYGSHLLLDYLTVDTTPPRGIPLFWPLSDAAYISPVLLFTDLHHGRSWAAFLNWHNAGAVLVEALVLGIPVLVLCGGRLARAGRLDVAASR